MRKEKAWDMKNKNRLEQKSKNSQRTKTKIYELKEEVKALTEKLKKIKLPKETLNSSAS